MVIHFFPEKDKENNTILHKIITLYGGIYFPRTSEKSFNNNHLVRDDAKKLHRSIHSVSIAALLSFSSPIYKKIYWKIYRSLITAPEYAQGPWHTILSIVPPVGCKLSNPNLVTLSPFRSGLLPVVYSCARAHARVEVLDRKDVSTTLWVVKTLYSQLGMYVYLC